MYKFLILVVFIAAISNAQPKATVQFFGGYSLPLGMLKGSFGDTTITPNNSDSLTYLMSSGINYGISYKRPMFIKKGNLNLVGSLLFNSFRQSKDYNAVSVKLKLNMFSLSLGGEWQFAPKRGKVNPFVNLQFMANMLNGSLTQEFSSTTYSMAMKTAFRLGFITGGGIDFPFHQNVGVVVGINYAFANVIGKDYTPNTDKNYYLNDKKYVLDNVNYEARDIRFLQFYAGVSFYFGK